MCLILSPRRPQSQHRTLRCTIPQPFKFEHRESLSQRKPIMAAKLEAELALKRQEEQAAVSVSTGCEDVSLGRPQSTGFLTLYVPCLPRGLPRSARAFQSTTPPLLTRRRLRLAAEFPSKPVSQVDNGAALLDADGRVGDDEGQQSRGHAAVVQGTCNTLIGRHLVVNIGPISRCVLIIYPHICV